VTCCLARRMVTLCRGRSMQMILRMLNPDDALIAQVDSDVTNQYPTSKGWRGYR